VDKRDFFARWDEAFRVTRQTVEAFPQDALGREVIAGLRPPGQIFCHIFAHVNAVFNACVTGQLVESELYVLPDDVDTTSHTSLLRYAQKVMQQLFAHASVGPEVWDQKIDTRHGIVPMDTLCLDSFAHELHHRGQLATMLRVLDIKPPSVCRHEQQ